MKPVAIVGTFDTKGTELEYVAGAIEAQGLSVFRIDTGTIRSLEHAQITSEDIAQAAGTTLESLQTEKDRGKSVSAMSAGIGKVVRGLYDSGKISGVLSLGGSAGTTIGTAAMRALPVGIPKVMVSTMASGDVGPYVGVKDIVMMYSVVDVAGLNRVSRKVFRNAAGAICGMVKAAEGIQAETERPIVAATMFGVTTPCVTRAREVLEEAGYEVLVFHATGSGGRAMESLIEDGEIDGVLDITTTEWCDELVGGVLSAGPTRLEAAAKAGIPQVVSVGALDMVNFGPRETVPARFENRNLYIHNPTVTLMRTSKEEMSELGRILADKVSQARGPCAVFIPRKGVSAIDTKGGPFWDAEADSACFEALRSNLSGNIEVHDLENHVNDNAFAEAMAKRLIEMLEAKRDS
jgi:uncharacterized protein (UPF0261 family)